MPTSPWWAECRLRRIFVRCEVGIMILWFNSARSLSTLRRCLTSQYSRIPGAVRMRSSRESLLYCLNKFDVLWVAVSSRTNEVWWGQSCVAVCSKCLPWLLLTRPNHPCHQILSVVCFSFALRIEVLIVNGPSRFAVFFWRLSPSCCTNQ